MECLLVEPKRPRSWGHNNQYVGLLRIGSALQFSGHRVEWVVSPAMPQRLQAPEEIYITSLFTYDYQHVWDAVKFYRGAFPGAKIMLGGIYATIMPEHAAQAGADEVHAGQHPLGAESPPDPSILPYPQDFGYLFTSYGCDMACTYCATHLLYGEGIRQLPVDRVIDEIRFITSRGLREVWFGDDNILYGAATHINNICEAILTAGIDCRFRIQGGMSAKDFTRKTALLMRRAGFVEISFAIESTDSEVLRRMGRKAHTDNEMLVQALRYADEAGFRRDGTNVYFIIGLPYQSVGSMVDTAAFLVSQGVWAHPQRLTPIPHTVEWKRLGLENVDPAELHYTRYIAPGEFTAEDLGAIYQICRFVNMGTRYAGGNSIMARDRVSRTFWQRLSNHYHWTGGK